MRFAPRFAIALPLAISALACLGIFEAATAAVQTVCTSVDSRKGWQRAEFPPSSLYGVTYAGAWSVDGVNYEKVGPDGHTGADAVRLGPFDEYKFDNSEPFGVLLVRTPDGSTYSFLNFATNLHFAEQFGIDIPLSYLEFRINDSEEALTDNIGSIELCFNIEE